MIGERYWSTGITVKAGLDGKWSASLTFHDDGFCEDASTEGELYARYLVPTTSDRDGLTFVIDTLKADAERLGIEFRQSWLYYYGDGEDQEWPPPEGWRELLYQHAERIGFVTYEHDRRLIQALGGDDTTTCERCGQSFPDEVAWQDHYEDVHGHEEDA